MGKFSNIAGSLVVAFSLSAHGAETQEPDVSKQQTSKYSGFITTMKSLCQTHDHILIGDTNHFAPEINELMSDKDFLQTIKDCNRPLVLERPVEENEGYRQLERFLTPEAEQELVSVIQEELGMRADGQWSYDVQQTLQDFIAEKQQELGWKEDELGIFSIAFANELSRVDPSQNKLLLAASHLKETSFKLDYVTLSMKYDDIQKGYRGAVKFDPAAFGGDENMYRRVQAGEDQIFHAAKMDLPLVYIDSRAQDMRDDPELWNFILTYTSQIQIQTKDEMITQSIKDMAEYNRSLENRAVSARLKEFLDKSLSTSNRDIIDNLERLLPGQKTVVMYGSGHMMAAQDMNEMLGTEKTAVIYLKPRPDTIRSIYNPAMPEDNSDVPEYLYDIASDTMTKIEEGTPSEQAYKSLVDYVIMPEEYQQATQALSEELKPYALPYTEFDADLENNIMTDEWAYNGLQYKDGKVIKGSVIEPRVEKYAPDDSVTETLDLN